MKLEFDNLAVYAASIGIERPIVILDRGMSVWGTADDECSYHCAISDEAPPDLTGEWDYHEIGIPLSYDLTDSLKGLRHELEHARQLEEIGYFEWYSSYGWLTKMLTTGGPNPQEQYRWNPYEIEANHVMETEWQDLLPYVKGPT